MIIKLAKLISIICSMFLLTACPSKYQDLEATYFSDNYIQTIIKANNMYTVTSKKKIKTFLTQNSTQLFKELYKELDIIAIQPSRKNIDDLNQLSHALNKLKSHFPRIITKNIYSNINKQIQNIVTIYAIQTSEKIDILITHKRYRQAVDELMSLKKNNLLTSEKKILLSNIKNYLKRTLYINTIKVHDETINTLVSQSQENQKTLYNQKGTLLAEKNINIPKEFKRSFFHYIKKESSPYLSIALSTSANYRVDISVGYHKESDIVETRKEIEDFFQVKFDANGYWHQQPVIYELFTKKETYFISINANAYLQKSNKHIAHYTFETQVPVESYRIGNYINLNPNIVNMLESETYKTYLIPPVSREEQTYIAQACDDAAHVLSIKLLNSIDYEPEPYAIAYPFLYINK